MNHEQNPRGGESRGTGNFKLNIDERDLATGSIDVQERRGQPPRPEYSVNKAYLTEKERRAERKAHKKRDKLKARKNRRVFLSICVFLVILLLFISGIDSFSDSTRRHQKESLERALNRSIVYCYATEGTYPESLEDLKAHYGLTYDEDLFFVDYQTVGANIYPDVTIIEKGAGK